MEEKQSAIKCENELCPEVVDVRCFRRRCKHLRVLDENMGKWVTITQQK